VIVRKGSKSEIVTGNCKEGDKRRKSVEGRG